MNLRRRGWAPGYDPRERGWRFRLLYVYEKTKLSLVDWWDRLRGRRQPRWFEGPLCIDCGHPESVHWDDEDRPDSGLAGCKFDRYCKGFRAA